MSSTNHKTSTELSSSTNKQLSLAGQIAIQVQKEQQEKKDQEKLKYDNERKDKVKKICDQLQFFLDNPISVLNEDIINTAKMGYRTAYIDLITYERNIPNIVIEREESFLFYTYKTTEVIKDPSYLGLQSLYCDPTGQDIVALNRELEIRFLSVSEASYKIRADPHYTRLIIEF